MQHQSVFSFLYYRSFQDFKFLSFSACFITALCWHNTFSPGEVVLCCAKILRRAFAGFQKRDAINENSMSALGWEWQNRCAGASWPNSSPVGLNRRPLITFHMPNLIPFNHLKRFKNTWILIDSLSRHF